MNNDEIKLIDLKATSSSNWFRKNFNKITLVLAAIGALTGSIGLIVGSVANHKVNKTSELNYYLTHDKGVIWGAKPIWASDLKKLNHLGSGKFEFHIYFADTPNKTTWQEQDSHYDDQYKVNIIDIEWDGTYPNDYFEKDHK